MIIESLSMNFDNWKQQDLRAFLRANYLGIKIIWHAAYLEDVCITIIMLPVVYVALQAHGRRHQYIWIYVSLCVIEYHFVSIVHNWVYVVKFCINCA